MPEDEQSTAPEGQQAETTTEAATPSIRETLEENYNAMLAENEEGQEDVTGQQEEEGQAEEVNTETESNEEENTEEIGGEGSEGESGEETLEAPAEWNDAEKEAFAALSEIDGDGAKKLRDRYTNLQGEFTRRSQENADLKRGKDEIDGLFSGIQNDMQRDGTTQAVVISKLLGWHDHITKDPAAAIQALAKSNGIDLTEIAFGGDDEDDDFESEDIKKLRAEVQELKNKNSNDEQQRATATHEQVVKDAGAFAAQTDEDGNLVHPHCGDVVKEMAQLLQQGKSLDEAYDQAIWTNPTVRAKLLKDSASPKDTESPEAKKARIARAKKGGKSISNSSGKKPAAKQKQSMSLRDELKTNYAALSN